MSSCLAGSQVNGTQTFRPIVSLHHYLVKRFAPNSYIGKTFRPRGHNIERRTLTKFQKDVPHPDHISVRHHVHNYKRRFAPFSF